MARDLGDDLDGIEDTDKNPVPQVAKRKLTLAKPDDFDDPAKAPDPKVTHKPTAAKPRAPAAAARTPRIPLFLRRTIAKIGLADDAGDGRGDRGAFALAPDGGPPAWVELPQELAARSTRSGGSEREAGSSIRDWLPFGSSKEEAKEQPPPTKWISTPPPVRRRHGTNTSDSDQFLEPVPTR